MSTFYSSSPCLNGGLQAQEPLALNLGVMFGLQHCFDIVSAECL